MLDVIRRNSQSWVVKAIFAAIILTFVFWGANTVTSSSADVLAEVNGQPIYRNDLMRELRVEIQDIQRNNPEIANLSNDELDALSFQILGQMLRRELMAQEATKLGIAVSDEEFTALVSSMPEFHDLTGRFSEAIYRDAIKTYGVQMGQFESMLATDMQVSKLQSYIAGAVHVDAAEARRVFDFELEQRTIDYLPFHAVDYRNAVKPDEAAIITYYSENKGLYAVPAKAELEYLAFDTELLSAQSKISDEDIKNYYEERKSSFAEPESFRVRHILISLPLSLSTTDEDVLAARKKAEAVLAEVRKEEKSFATLAQEYSDDAATKDNGGELGWVEKGQLDPSLELALSELPLAVASEPVRSFNGFHILQKVEGRAERAKALSEVRQDILSQLKEDAAFANLGKTMADVEDKIISKVGFGGLADEYGVSAKSTGVLELAQLADAIGVNPASLAGVPDVPAGEMLPSPIELGTGFVVVRVKSYKASYVPEMAEIKDKLIEAIKDRESIKLASDAAASAAKEIPQAGGKLPRALAGKVKTSMPTSRFLGVMELGVDKELTSALFNAADDQWLERVFLVGDSAVLARVARITPPAEKDWADVSATYTQGLRAARQNEVFNAYLTQLQKEAKIEIKTERIISR